MNYTIINVDTIQKRIEELKKLAESNLKNYYGYHIAISELKLQLSNSIPLIPEIEKCFTAAREFNSLDGVVDIDVVVGYYPETRDLQGVFINSEDYISQLKLDI